VAGERYEQLAKEYRRAHRRQTIVRCLSVRPGGASRQVGRSRERRRPPWRAVIVWLTGRRAAWLHRP